MPLFFNIILYQEIILNSIFDNLGNLCPYFSANIFSSIHYSLLQCPNNIILLFQLYFNLKIDSHHSDCLPANEIFGFGHYPCLSTAITKRNSHRSGSYRWIAKSTITEQTLPINRQIDHICRFDSTLYYMKSQRKYLLLFHIFYFTLQ